jgi:biopolymer transport protein ExbB
MKALARFTCGLVAAFFLAPVAGVAQEPAQAPKAPAATAGTASKTLDDLLQKTRTARQREAELDAAREQEFRTSRDRQAQMLAQARAEKAAAERRTEELNAQFDANEKRIKELEATLRERSGYLGELFGVTRQVAADTAQIMNQSMISAEYPEREAFFRKIASAKELPLIPELERMWYELQLEMTESGRVARVEAQVVDPEGKVTKKPIVRVGPFTAISDGEYMTYLPQQKAHQVVPRQPSGHYLSLASDVEDATEGYVAGAVDPSRGVITGLYADRPTTMERIEKGEAVGYVIIFVGLLGTIAAIYQTLFLAKVRLAVSRQLKNIQRPTSDNPLGRVLLAFKGDPNRIEEQADVAELRLSEAVLREVPPLERFQAFLRLVVAAGPLLGLIGTVVGMIITFQSITESGSSDPRLMANGISQAMIATVLGLGIAIPLLFANALLAAMSRQVVQILDEQSAGLLAENIEAKRDVPV